MEHERDMRAAREGGSADAGAFKYFGGRRSKDEVE
jgi:hypothetical protein